MVLDADSICHDLDEMAPDATAVSMGGAMMFPMRRRHRGWLSAALTASCTAVKGTIAPG